MTDFTTTYMHAPATFAAVSAVVGLEKALLLSVGNRGPISEYKTRNPFAIGVIS